MDLQRNWPRQLSFTREGKYFIGITLGVGFAAINTGNNLLYLLLGMMLSLIIVSGILSEMVLRELEVTRRPPLRIYANQPFLMTLSLRNAKRRFASFSIEVQDLLFDRLIEKRCYFLKLPPGRHQETSYRYSLPRRGRHSYTGLQIATKFPFALFRKSRRVHAPCEVVVFPEVRPIDTLPLLAAAQRGEQLRGQRSRRGEFHSLREFRPGDDPHDIHWRTSARRGRVMLREHEEETLPRVTLLVDNGLPASADDAAREALEETICRAASLAVALLERSIAVRLIARGQGSDALTPWVQNPARADLLLRMLALLPTVDDSVPFAAMVEPATALVRVDRAAS